MKKLGRRNLATLTFIAVLAVIYLVILLMSRSHDDADVAAPALPAPVVAPDSVTTAPAAVVDTAKSSSRRRNSSSRSRKTGRSTPPPDNPDVFDSPVPNIHRE